MMLLDEPPPSGARQSGHLLAGQLGEHHFGAQSRPSLRERRRHRLTLTRYAACSVSTSAVAQSRLISKDHVKRKHATNDAVAAAIEAAIRAGTLKRAPRASPTTAAAMKSQITSHSPSKKPTSTAACERGPATIELSGPSAQVFLVQPLSKFVSA